ncbi:hypothetical protein E2C01_005492 [Portunus trituberculatus]|uniref:Uncharacterized protein n=1 Tax=Portunus trituberculatus TaxID=210409 RepID=A0A5B7CVN8_PORTR|nr:hypothetical protein [Portunus trituberculatus]
MWSTLEVHTPLYSSSKRLHEADGGASRVGSEAKAQKRRGPEEANCGIPKREGRSSASRYGNHTVPVTLRQFLPTPRDLA